MVKGMAKVKSNVHIWGFELNRYICFLFHVNQTFFGGDIDNSLFVKVTVMAKVKSYGRILGLDFTGYVCFLFRGNLTNCGRDIYQFPIWLWKF